MRHPMMLPLGPAGTVRASRARVLDCWCTQARFVGDTCQGIGINQGHVSGGAGADPAGPTAAEEHPHTLGVGAALGAHPGLWRTCSSSRRGGDDVRGRVDGEAGDREAPALFEAVVGPAGPPAHR